MSDTLPPEVTALLRQATLTEATELACDGRFDAAEELLKPLLAAAPDNGMLDLLARIRIQRGDVPGAAALWQEVLRRDPAHAGARAALDRLARLQSRRPWLGGLRLAVGGVVALTVLAALVLAGHRSLNRHAQMLADWRDEHAAARASEQARADERAAALEARVREVQAALAAQSQDTEALTTRLDGLGPQIQAVLDRQQTLQQQQAGLGAQAGSIQTGVATGMQQLDARLAALEQRPAPAVAAPPVVAPPVPREDRLGSLRFTIPGVTEVRRGDAVELRFDAPLLSGAASLRAEALPLLAAIGGEIGRAGIPCTVEVAGFAGPVRFVWPWTRHRTPEALALARALAVAEPLRRCGLPADCTVRVVNDPALIAPAFTGPDPRSVVLRLRLRE